MNSQGVVCSSHLGQVLLRDQMRPLSFPLTKILPMHPIKRPQREDLAKIANGRHKSHCAGTAGDSHH